MPDNYLPFRGISTFGKKATPTLVNGMAIIVLYVLCFKLIVRQKAVEVYYYFTRCL